MYRHRIFTTPREYILSDFYSSYKINSQYFKLIFTLFSWTRSTVSIAVDGNQKSGKLTSWGCCQKSHDDQRFYTTRVLASPLRADWSPFKGWLVFDMKSHTQKLDLQEKLKQESSQTRASILDFEHLFVQRLDEFDRFCLLYPILLAK